MGRHNKEKRKAYLKRRKEKIREVKFAQEDNLTSHIQVDSPASATRSHIFTEDTCNSHTLSSSSSSLFPTSLASLPLPSTRGQICVKAAKSVCTSQTSSTTAAILRGEIPKRVQNDILMTKWEEYKLLYKQLTLIKKRLNVMEYGKRGQMLNQMRVDMKRWTHNSLRCVFWSFLLVDKFSNDKNYVLI